MAVLRQVETGERVADIGRKMGINQAAHYAWRKSRVRGERVASVAAATRRERPVEAVGGGLERKPTGYCRRSCQKGRKASVRCNPCAESKGGFLNMHLRPVSTMSFRDLFS